MYLLATFILQNLKKILELIQSYEDAIFRPKIAQFALNNFFLVQTIIINLIYLLALFIVQNLKTFLQWIQRNEDAPFLDPKWSICPNLFCKIINIILIYLLAPFIEQNFKKILPVDPQLWGCTIFGPKMAHFPKWFFFSEKLLMSLVSFIHAYLHAKNQSQILIY